MSAWRCTKCEKRFHARAVPLSRAKYARCSICGNQELQKISSEYIAGPMALVARMLGLPALRCEPCRHKFFAVRPVMRVCPRATAASRHEAA
jgi:DNA-directed RNA polymerase subunit RPC12/RpoP